ncbi:predicted protein [Aspergillus terreus NIH2624]|uniref:Uncharacterized protein n=1 Tax=Aspergillus terreus (strain NIH 2624 / FGSC A1156) TaxID=341663 RepID=Q0C8P7_ASPTN|nr:uncharacterized protein ATEG_09937 [Aspergillus terreus NIH2624]EAU30128.1 predicted protein [Aspergillus terreus NIH2624]
MFEPFPHQDLCASRSLIFAAIPALLTVFLNVVRDPQDSFSTDDAKRLAITAGIMERVLLSDTSEKEESSDSPTVDFVAELKWLGEYAASNARITVDVGRVYHSQPL